MTDRKVTMPTHRFNLAANPVQLRRSAVVRSRLLTISGISSILDQMAGIPDLGVEGYLPEGIHTCTIDEVTTIFGEFQESDRRVRLAAALRRYHDELVASKIGKALLIDGSFVTAEARPNDIDLVLVLPDDFDLKASVPPFEYNARSKKFVKKNYGFDLFPAFEHDLGPIVDLFSKVKERPDIRKGLLRVEL